MKIVEPNVELWSEEGVTPEEHIARCAAVCYDSHPKDPKKLVDFLVKHEHKSMLRHASKYYLFKGILPRDTAAYFDICPYNNKFEANITDFYLSTNLQENIYSENFIYVGYEREFSPSELLEECKMRPKLFEIFRLTFCITTQISTSRELNRVSPNNIAERSTRYCSSKDGLEICKPWWWNGQRMEDAVDPPEWYAYFSWMNSERMYQSLLRKGKMKPEDARGVLPLDTATKVVYTYSVTEWKHIIDLRYYGKTGKPHPNAKLVIGMVRDKINEFAKAHNIDYQV